MASDPIETLAKTICQNHNYTFIRSCDAGAFKKTFHVQDGSTDLALKLVVNPIDPARVQREIDALRACSHPNISRLLGAGTINHQGAPLVYFVEEFLSGGTLGARLRGGVLSRAEGRHVAVSLADALSHLAPRGIVHRDIKPENVMYREDGTPVLVDLGIARHLDESSLTQDWLARGPGTPAFSAPEQLNNAKHLIDWRTDQFSLGITLSMALLGMHPYSGDLILDQVLVDRMTRRDPPTTRFIDAAKDTRLDLLIKMVEPWPIKRFLQPRQLVTAWQMIGDNP
jgi:serine/threonine protein kinase